MKEIIALVPAYNPTSSFPQLLEAVAHHFTKIIIINDGSKKEYDNLFSSLPDKCIVIAHQTNEGKGNAIKTGIQYITRFYPHIFGVVMFGAHSQHEAKDITHVVQSTGLFNEGLIVGVREFRKEDLPLVTVLANRAATLLFDTLFQKRLLDSQSGLRFVSAAYVPWLKTVKGKRFSYDTNMLVDAIKKNIPIYEIPIGRARLSKNSFLQYDEIQQPAIVVQQIWSSFIKSRFKQR